MEKLLYSFPHEWPQIWQEKYGKVVGMENKSSYKTVVPIHCIYVQLSGNWLNHQEFSQHGKVALLFPAWMTTDLTGEIWQSGGNVSFHYQSVVAVDYELMSNSLWKMFTHQECQLQWEFIFFLPMYNRTNYYGTCRQSFGMIFTEF